jgi:hypothetical protein
LYRSTFHTRTTDCRRFFARKHLHPGLISEERRLEIHIDIPSRDHGIYTIGCGRNGQSSYEFSQGEPWAGGNARYGCFTIIVIHTARITA